MFGGLFEDEQESSFDGPQQGSGPTRSDLPRPPASRGGVNLCGLSNLGATCYMNALLQTMTYTPELREALFSLTDEELGLAGDKQNPIRGIPVQLQSLFSRILLLDQSSVGVEGLIGSFGWTNNEELQQHDVQELNRILFDALESSLIGTSGHKVVHRLFHGTSVQQIICDGCGQISEREEDFLDLPIPLLSKSGLEGALKEMFCDTEKLDGNNQYHCEVCRGLRDAKRCCRLRTLPPILTFALLRFLYDYQKGERYKDTNKFQFPLTLDMTPYVDTKEEEGLVYDLFSVVIHTGSTHSGHYIAYIRDIDGLGTWTHPSKEAVSLRDDDSESTDPLEFNSPLELLQAILRQLDGSASIDLLCKRLKDQTGVTWNKRFKNGYGPIRKFLEKNSNVFVFESNQVSLKDSSIKASSAELTGDDGRVVGGNAAEDNTMNVDKPSADGSPSVATHQTKFDQSLKTEESETSETTSGPVPGECWFEFNDSSVSSIATDSIKKMFQGKQSAYMLFYRQRDLQRPKEAMNNPFYGVPDRLVQEILQANETLKLERENYELAINKVTLTLHLAPLYSQETGTLKNYKDGLTYKVEIDRRSTISELQAKILQVVDETDFVPSDPMVIHTAKILPAGLHIYDCITDSCDGGGNNSSKLLIEAGITSDSHLFVWDGVQVGGFPVSTGAENEPVFLQLSYPGENGMVDISRGFPKSSVLFQIREYFCGFMDCSPPDITINQVKRSTKSGNASAIILPVSKDSCTLSDLKLDNGDRLAAELKTEDGKNSKTFARSVAEMQNKQMIFIVENRCLSSVGNVTTDTNYPVHPVEVSKMEKLLQVKTHILSQLGLSNLEGGSRLRLDDDLQGIGPPLCEAQSLVEAGITHGCRVVLEEGSPPATNEIYLNCSSEYSSMDTGPCEVIVPRTITVKECCRKMAIQLGLEGEDWHLRKVNWCGEPGEVLDDEEASLERLRLRSGETLRVDMGKLPPKGFVRITVHKHQQYTTQELQTTAAVAAGNREDVQSMEMCKEDASNIVPLHEQDPAQYYPPPIGSVTGLDMIEIKKDSTLQQLKETIMTLPGMVGANLPSIKFLRVREISNGRPGKIYKQLSLNLKQMKLYSGGDICVQVLPYEEDLLPSEIVFYIQVRIPSTRTYGQPLEVTYDTAHSTSPMGLRNFIAKFLGIPQDKTGLAKHKYESFQWIKIEDKNTKESVAGDSSTSKGGGRKTKGRTKGASTHINIKNSPILLRDGDIIGIKDLRLEEKAKEDDYSTEADDRGAAILLAIQEEKRKRRKAKTSGLDSKDFTDNKRQRRPEVGIKIFVPDFSTTASHRQQ